LLREGVSMSTGSSITVCAEHKQVIPDKDKRRRPSF
jgi:hypothetical protein